MSTSICGSINSKTQIDRSQYLPQEFLSQENNLQPIGNNQGNVKEFVFQTPPSLTGLFQTNESISTPAFIDGSIQYLGFDNGFGNWNPGQTFSVNYGELCPCLSSDTSACINFASNQMGNFAGPYSNDGLDNYKIAFCSSTATNGYGCTGLFQNLIDGKIDFDATVFGSLYNPANELKTGIDSNLTFWRVGNPLPLGKTLMTPDNSTTLDSMQLYFNMPSEGGVQPCGTQYPSNATQTNEWWSYGNIGKVFEFDPQLGACSQRVVCPGGICEGDFPRKTPDGPINYWDDVHDDYSGIVISNKKDNNTGNSDGYGNDLFCEVFYSQVDAPGIPPNAVTYPVTVNRQVQQTDTSFPTSMFGNITLYDQQSEQPPNYNSGNLLSFTSSNAASNYAACSKPISDFPYGNFFTVNNPANAHLLDYVSWNCQVSNPQIVPFSTQSSSNPSTVKENNNQVPAGYFYWDENDVNTGTGANVGDWSSTTYNGNPIPGIGFTVQAQYDALDGFYGGNAGGNRTFNLSGAGYNKATQRTKPASGSGPGFAVRTFCPSLYGPLGAGRQYCGFGGAANIPGSDQNLNTSTPVIYTNLYNGQDPNCAVNAQMYALANEYDFAENNWMPEDWKLYYMYLDEYGMDGNGLCPLLGDTCKNTSSPTPIGQLFIEPNCVNCLAGNFAYGVMYNAGESPSSGGAYDSSLIMANGTPMNMRGNMQSASYPGTKVGDNPQVSYSNPSAASSLMGCDRMIGYQTVDYNNKTIGVHATCACTSESACYCWNTAGDLPTNNFPAIYNPQGSGGPGSGGEGNCWLQQGYDNNINRY